jgi:hypothetical protein
MTENLISDIFLMPKTEVINDAILDDGANDGLDGHWLSDEVIEQHLSAGKAVCIVSPELHKRSYEKEWQHYYDLEKKPGKDRLMLCTDLPERAKEFFNA